MEDIKMKFVVSEDILLNLTVMNDRVPPFPLI